jgi:hypothetical protein
VVKRYIESYRDQHDQWPVTQSAVATAGVEAVADAVDELSQRLQPVLADEWPQLLSAQTNAVRFTFDLVDLASLSGALQASGASAEVKEAAKALDAALTGDGYVLADDHLGDEVDGCRGVSAYMPAPPNPVSPYYADLALSRDHDWDELLEGYAAAVRRRP